MAFITAVEYMYRDSDNYKVRGTVNLIGSITDEQREQVRATLNADGQFIPEQIGWAHLGTEMPAFPDPQSDQCWHELDVDDITVFMPVGAVHSTETVDHWVFQMTRAAESGWDDVRFAR